MIQLISKKEFQSHFSEDTNYIRVFNDLIDLTGNCRYFEDYNTAQVYLLIDNTYYVVYIPSVNYLLIPETYDVEDVKARVIKDSKVLVTDWKLEKVSDEITYSLNTFKIVEDQISITRENLRPELEDGKEKGSWCLINERTGEEIAFELKPSWSSDETTYKEIAYEEKAKRPVIVKEIKEKSNFIKLLIHGCKKSV